MKFFWRCFFLIKNNVINSSGNETNKLAKKGLEKLAKYVPPYKIIPPMRNCTIGLSSIPIYIIL